MKENFETLEFSTGCGGGAEYEVRVTYFSPVRSIMLSFPHHPTESGVLARAL